MISRLQAPHRTAAMAKDATTHSRCVASFGTIHQHLQIRAPSDEGRWEPAYGASKEEKDKWEGCALREQHPSDESPIPPQNAIEDIKAGFALDMRYDGFPTRTGGPICRVIA